MNNIITILDIPILLITVFIVYWIFFKIRDKRYPKGHPWRPYFIPALTFKIAGAIFVTLIYAYYYKGGDTINYFNQAKIINSSLSDSFIKWIKLLTQTPTIYTSGYYEYISQLFWYKEDPSTYYTCAITAVLSLCTLETLLPTAVLFAVLSFSGIWALFQTFAKIYPSLTKPIAIAACFIPSVAIWGSGIFKDTICMFALGWLCFTTFEVLINKKISFKYLLTLTLSILVLGLIKVYILMAFLPAIVMWILFNYSKSIKNQTVRLVLIIFVIAITIGISYLFFMQLGSETLGKYSLDKIAKTAIITRDYIVEKSSDQSSAYDLGDYSSIEEMILKFPAAVNVTLFRPYLWESSKLIVLFNAIESLLYLLITIKVLFSVGLRKIWKTIISDPNIQFFLIFTFIFAFAIGLTSGNFGTLSRYKIPCLPFYLMALALIFYKNKSIKEKHLFKLIGL
ncbi:MAG: hypothetical protein ACK5NK_13020 [Niabella sp.]